MLPGGADQMATMENPTQANLPSPDESNAVRIAAIVLRTLFIGILLVIVAFVSAPQNETLWTVYDTTGDLVRLILGILVCVWLVVQLFQGPRDAKGYRTWLYLGLFAVPFALICLYAVW
jgi:hypothetical protein